MSIIKEQLILSENLGIIAKLNEMLKLDKAFTKQITNTRYIVNEAYANSNFTCLDEGDGKCSAGLLGVLNGIIAHGWDCEYRIAANYDDNNILTHFILYELQDGKMTKVK